MAATQAQIEELAGSLAAQAEAISAGRIPVEDYRAKIALMVNNVATLHAWTASGPQGQDWYLVPGVKS